MTARNPRLSADAEGRVPEGSAAQKNWLAIMGTIQRLQDENARLDERVASLERTVSNQTGLIASMQQAFAMSIPRGSGPTVTE